MVKDKYSAGEQALGYTFQSRLALLKIFQLPESIAILVEKEDDLDFVDEDGVKSLGSLKHKSMGDRLTDLSVDFWKSVRIWLDRYEDNGKIECSLRFFIFTTSETSEDSFLVNFLSARKSDPSEVLILVDNVLSKTRSKEILPIKDKLYTLVEDERKDFLSRITIIDKSPRIDDIPGIIISQHMRTVRSEFRTAVFERLEGWWHNLVISLLTGERTTEIFGYEVSDKLSSIADEYKTDNLPITFRTLKPEKEADPENDPRMFVVQLRKIGISLDRIRSAIYDYYRAFEQRSLWVRENLLIEGEVEDYEDRLVEEWSRYRDVVFESLDDESAEERMKELGKELYKWAEFNTDQLKIRERVSEPYVVRGGFHILANEKPKPKVYWHPRFLEGLDNIISGSAK